MSEIVSVVRKVWLAMTSVIFVYVVVGFLAGDERVDPELAQWVAIFMGVAAFSQAIVVVLLKPMIAGVSGGNYTIYCVVRWSLVEAIALYGMVLRLIGASWTMATGFFVVAFVLMALTGPSEDESREFTRW